MVELKKVSFSYDNKNNVIKDFSLCVNDGEFVTLLGPSGCGKTTILKLIAGFVKPASGSVFIDGVNQEKVSVDKRKVGIVFQDYALFPHLDVYKNIEYPLANGAEKTPKALRPSIVKDLAVTLGISDLLSRYPSQLSGGQQQRVALARSLAQNPKVLLMDEPLSSLDSKLRISVRENLKSLQRKLKFTTIYVTHDQEEAFFLSDRVALVNNGNLEQFSSPEDVYFSPQTEFASTFISKLNIFSTENNIFAVRPEWFSISGEAENGDVDIAVESVHFLGSTTEIIAKNCTTKEAVVVKLPSLDAKGLNAGDKITLRILKRILYK